MSFIYANPNLTHYEKESELCYRKPFHHARFIAKNIKGDVLDLGAGQGTLTDVLCSHASSVTCVEISEYNRRILESKGYATVTADLDVYPLAFEDASFDTIVLSDVIEHLLSPYLMFVELRRIIKPNGLVFISTPDVRKNPKVTIPHTYYFTMESLSLMAKRCGFDVDKVYHNGVISSELTRLTMNLPVIQSIVSNGLYVMFKPIMAPEVSK